MHNIVEEVLERFKIVDDYETDIRKLASDDINFVYKTMWSDQDKKIRQGKGQNKPCLEFNLCLKEIKKLSNELRLNAPSVKVSPEDGEADKDTAEAIAGLIKQILKNSNFDSIVAQCAENSIESSFGYARVKTKYVNEDSFNQIVDVEYINNPFSVYIDPESNDIAGADAEYVIITNDIPKKEFEKQYPSAEFVNAEISTIGDNQIDWLSDDTVRIAEYYKLIKVKDRLIEGINSEGEIVEGLASSFDDVDSIVIARERPTVRKKWMWYKVTGAEILEERELAGSMCPIIAFYGRKKNIDNKKHLYSLIRFSKDANRMYNYWRSSEAEQLNQSQKTPYIGLKGQFKSDRGWKDANVTNRPYLEYDQVPMSNGQTAPAPQRVAAPEPPIGYISAAQSSKEDVKETMGFGNQMQNVTTGSNKSQATPNALSGIALETLNANGEMATYDFIDNINKSTRQIFRVINDIIPTIYDTERVERILGDDNIEKLVAFNTPNEDGKLYDMSVGRYDIDIDVGPDHATKRKQTAENMISFLGMLPPEKVDAVADLVAETQDFKNSDKFSDRFKKQLAQTNPTLLEDDEQDGNTMQIQLSQTQAELENVTQQLEQAIQLIESQQIQKEMVETKEQGAIQRELIKSDTALTKQQIDTDGEIKEETIKAQSDIITTLINNQQELTNQLNDLTLFVQNGNSQPQN